MDPNPRPIPAAELEELRSLVRRTEQDDPEALPAIRRWLDGHPHVWQSVGDLAAAAERAWLILAVGDDLVARECMARWLAERRQELAAEGASPLEDLLVRQLAL